MARKTNTEQVQVTWEDQRNINEFSRLNMRRHELEALIAGVKKQLEDLDDASAELVLADDDDDGGDGDGSGSGDDEAGGGAGVRLRIGDAFLYAPKDDVEARVDALADEARAKLAGYEGEAAEVAGRLTELKGVLYSRLGSGNINLEE